VKSRIPSHVGLIPDGNRRWAVQHGLRKEEGYASGIAPGFELFERCRQLGIPEVSVFGFTQDNTRRPAVQADAFRQACTTFALQVAELGASLLVLGDDRSPQFPAALRPFRQRRGDGIKVNFLVNYGWQWDLEALRTEGRLKSHEVSPVDLVVRWGGGRRLSGFLPVQCVYADLFVVDAHWPDFEPSHFDAALEWFRRQDRTLGG
jgi:undecaprenyl diphosphate synthase